MSDQVPRKSASLRLAEPTELAGDWRIAAEGRPACAIRFDMARVETANAHVLADPTRCLATLAGRPVAGWRPAPDGIEIVGSDGLTLLFFAHTGDGVAIVTQPDESRLTLGRAKEPTAQSTLR